jgi:hypothetical protein
MIEGSCHCGAVNWQFDGTPTQVTSCNCTLCRRYGVLWAYDFEGERITVAGRTRSYEPRESIGFHFCSVCGCLAYWRSLKPAADGRRRIAVNVRLAEPTEVADIPVDRLDGYDKWEHLPRDGRTVQDYWF